MAEDELDTVKKKIQEAHEAENALLHTMPNAIQPDEGDYPGMTPTSTTSFRVENTDAPQPPSRESVAMEAIGEETGADPAREDHG